MRGAIAAALGLLMFYPNSASAHEISSTSFSPRPMVSDVNTIALLLETDTLRNHNIITISAVGCGAFRIAMRDQIVENTQFLHQVFGYAPPAEIDAVEIGDFISFEVEVFREFGANDAAVNLLIQTIEEFPTLPSSSPAMEGSLSDELVQLADITCNVRNAAPGNMEEVATEEGHEYARTVGMALLGLGAMAADGAVAVVSIEGGPAAIAGASVLGMISGGWGWDRLKEGANAVSDIWERIFN